MVHIRWATYNARTLGALEAPQAIPPLKGVCGEGWVWREDSENSAAQYVRASNSPSVFSFLLSSHRASFLRIAHSPPSFRRRLSPPPSIYLSIHLYTSLAPTRRRLYPSPPLISSVTPSHPLRIPRCVRRRSYAQLDAQSDRSSIVRDDTRKRNCV